MKEGATATARRSLRAICEQCDSYGRTNHIDGFEFQARALDSTLSVGARYGLMESSQTLGQGLFTIVEGALDGRQWDQIEFQGAYVYSRATGGLCKTDCGWDPQKLKAITRKKVQRTELMYIHREICMRHYIGSILQGPSQAGGPNYFNGRSRLSEVSESEGLAVALMMYDFDSMARNLDGTNIWGNFTGEEKADGIAKFPHYDGVIKQALQQKGAEYYPIVELELPTLAEGELFWTVWYGNTQCWADAQEMVDGINGMCEDVSGENLYTATLSGTTLTIIGNDPTTPVYGDGQHLLIYVGDEFEPCADSLVATEIQCPMVENESPICIDFSRPITKENIHDYFLDVTCEINTKINRLSNSGTPLNLGYAPIVIDPELLDIMEVSRIKQLCECLNGEQFTGAIENFIPDFVGVEAMRGTRTWYWSPVSNLIFLTNTTDSVLQDTEIWYDRECSMIKSRNEMLGNVLVVNFCLFATNAFGSPFSKKLNAPYEPKNLPHWCPDVRKDCSTPSCVTPTNDGFAPGACVTFNAATEEGGECSLFLDDKSLLPAGAVATTWEWEIVFTDGTETQVVPDGTANMEVVVPCDAAIGYIQYTVTLDDGTTETIIVLGKDIEQN